MLMDVNQMDECVNDVCLHVFKLSGYIQLSVSRLSYEQGIRFYMRYNMEMMIIICHLHMTVTTQEKMSDRKMRQTDTSIRLLSALMISSNVFSLASVGNTPISDQLPSRRTTLKRRVTFKRQNLSHIRRHV